MKDLIKEIVEYKNFEEIINKKSFKEIINLYHIKDTLDKWRLIHSGIRFYSLKESDKLKDIEFMIYNHYDFPYEDEDPWCLYTSNIMCSNLDNMHHTKVTLNFIFEGNEINIDKLKELQCIYDKIDSKEPIVTLDDSPECIEKFKEYFSLFTREDALEDIINRFYEYINHNKSVTS